MPHRFYLDKTSKKFFCPACQKKRFVRYWDDDEKKYLPDYVGRCDREVSCGYDYKPKQLFKDNPELKSNYLPSLEMYNSNNKVVEQTPIPDFISPSWCNKTMQQYDNNHFVQLLNNLFHKDLSNQLVKQFNIGTSKRWRGATIFWQVDNDLKLRSGKIMLYNSATGKRMKRQDGRAYIDWVHSILLRKHLLQKFQLQQCLFGLHQLNTQAEDKAVAVVESEKTAILMTALCPKFIWMSCGSLSNLKPDFFVSLQNRKIILYPDLGCYEKWSEKSIQLRSITQHIHISDLLERKATENDKKEGLDLADFLIKRDKHFGWALTDNEYPVFWDK